MNEFLNEGYDISDFLYLNFEDNRLIEFQPNHFEEVLNAYFELFPGNKPILFLDEIHLIDKWERFVRRLVEQKFKVFITGSNAQMLSREYATHIARRYIELRVYPLSFKEFLRFKGKDYSKTSLISKDRFSIMKYLHEYLSYGGFPNVALTDKVLGEKPLESYLDTIIYKDSNIKSL